MSPCGHQNKQRTRMTRMNEVKILQDTETLVQIQTPKDTRVYWSDGFLVVLGGHSDGIPTKTLWKQKCPRPTVIAKNERNVGFWRQAPKKVKDIVFPYFEIAMNPLIKLVTVGRTSFVFGESKNMNMRTGNDPIHQALQGMGRIHLANEISDKVDLMRSRGKCRKVYVIYRIMPTCLPADDQGNSDDKGNRITDPAFGAVVFCEVVMFGVK